MDKARDIRKIDKTFGPGTVKTRIMIGAAFVCIFAILAIIVKTGASESLDESVRLWAYSIRNDILTPFFKVVTYFANWKVIVGLIAVMVFVPKTCKNIGLRMMITSIIAYAVYAGLKILFSRERPDALMWLVTEHGYSFPSGHTMNGLVCYGMLAVLVRRVLDNRKALANVLTVILIAIIILIGFSRLYLGVHYITDVLGGCSMGLAFVFFSLAVQNALRNRRKKD